MTEKVEEDMRGLHKSALSFFEMLKRWEWSDIPKHGLINLYKSIIEMAEYRIKCIESQKEQK